jgi:hypothetical protein
MARPPPVSVGNTEIGAKLCTSEQTCGPRNPKMDLSRKSLTAQAEKKMAGSITSTLNRAVVISAVLWLPTMFE